MIFKFLKYGIPQDSRYSQKILTPRPKNTNQLIAKDKNEAQSEALPDSEFPEEFLSLVDCVQQNHSTFDPTDKYLGFILVC